MFSAHGVDALPRLTRIEAVLQHPCSRVGAVGVDGREPTSDMVGIGQHRGGTGNRPVGPTSSLEGPAFVGWIAVKRFVQVTVE